jgi:hypothetical protein
VAAEPTARNQRDRPIKLPPPPAGPTAGGARETAAKPALFSTPSFLGYAVPKTDVWNQPLPSGPAAHRRGSVNSRPGTWACREDFRVSIRDAQINPNWRFAGCLFYESQHRRDRWGFSKSPQKAHFSSPPLTNRASVRIRVARQIFPTSEFSALLVNNPLPRFDGNGQYSEGISLYRRERCRVGKSS